MWYKSTTNVVIADNTKSRDPARTTFAHNRLRMDGWVLIPTGRTKNEGLNEGLGCVSLRNLQVLRCHPCACKFFCISFPLNSYPMVGRFKISLSKQARFWYFSITSRTKPSRYLKGCSDGQ